MWYLRIQISIAHIIFTKQKKNQTTGTKLKEKKNIYKVFNTL